MLKLFMDIDSQLQKIGLSCLQRQVYITALGHDSLTVKEVASIIKRPKESVNRTVNLLASLGFITLIGKFPAKLKAVPVEIATTNHLNNLFQIPGQLSKNVKYAPNNDLLRVITNRNSYHQVGKDLFNQCQKEVLVIASGTGDLFPEFIKTMVDKVRSGVSYKIIATTYNQANQEEIANLQKNNFQVKYYSGYGVNLVIYDRSIIQIGLRISDNSKEKWGIVINNQSLSQFLGDFFDFLWTKSKNV